MRRHGPSFVASSLALALACAAPRPPPAATAPVQPAAAAPSSAPIRPPVARGMDAGQVRRALGTPSRVERIDSAAAQGARYELWTYPDRQLVLLDGELLDVLPAPGSGPR